MLIQPIVQSFQVTFRVVPVWSWAAGALDEIIDFFTLDPIGGYLEVDFSIEDTLKGTFKISNPGSIVLDNGELPQSLSSKVCVK